MLRYNQTQLTFLVSSLEFSRHIVNKLTQEFISTYIQLITNNQTHEFISISTQHLANNQHRSLSLLIHIIFTINQNIGAIKHYSRN